MASHPVEDGLHVMEEEDVPASASGPWHTIDVVEAGTDEDGDPVDATLDESGLEGLRDEFVEAFNARDLDALIALVRADVECPDRGDDGVEVLAEELESVWERSPAALLTRAFLPSSAGGAACAVAWLPDEDGIWSRAALVCFDTDGELITLVTLADDVDAVERAHAEDPNGDELDDWADWARWDRGEETPAAPRP